MAYSTTHQSPFGKITLAADDGGNLTGLWFAEQINHGNDAFKNMTPKKDLPIFSGAKKWLDKYFAKKQPRISDLSLAPVGTEFRMRVWKILRDIPYGNVITYGDIAKKIATILKRDRMSSQAVGGAVGHNPISIIIPCHRVIGSNGSLTGYAGGLELKEKLLELEGAL